MLLKKCCSKDVPKQYKVNKLEDILTNHYGHNVKLSDTHFQTLQRTPLESLPHPTIHIDCRCTCKVRTDVYHLKLFIKLSPSCYMPLVLVQCLDIIPRFQKEIHAYTVAIPELTLFQKTEGINFRQDELFENLFPKCYGARLSLNEGTPYPDQDAIIVLENIKAKGYKELDPSSSLNLDFMKAIVAKLGLFHAVSVAFNQRHQERFDTRIRPCLIITNNSPESFVTVPSEINFIQGALANAGVDEYLDRINAAMVYSTEFMSRPPDTQTWIGMSHGKFFVFNIMVLTNKETNLVENCKIVDLQHSLRRHVLTDLALLLMTSSESNLLRDHLGQILHQYYTNFSEGLRRLDVDRTPYSYANFTSELKENIRKELLRGLQMIRFMAPKRECKEIMRAFSTWPRLDRERVEMALDRRLYTEKVKACVLNLIGANLLDDHGEVHNF